jgi:hypothetical protein
VIAFYGRRRRTDRSDEGRQCRRKLFCASAFYSGHLSKAFAFPYGGHDAVGRREIKAVMEAGFSVAATTQPGVLNSSNLDGSIEVGRVSLNGRYQKGPVCEGTRFRPAF